MKETRFNEVLLIKEEIAFQIEKNYNSKIFWHNDLIS